MKLGQKTLEEWLKKLPKASLKVGGDTIPYYEKYTTFKDYLDNNLHKLVTQQAIRVDFAKKKKLDTVIWLNDHGPNHIKTVVERASHLLNNGDKLELNAKEVFLLLNAIQVHDVGNFYGRVNHEKRVLDAIKQGLTPALFDGTEVNYVNNIASVHGGKVVYKDSTQSKDTISRIPPEVSTNGYNVKLQLLASILRFADELADDRYRSDTLALNEGRIPKGSEVFHAYASCLDTVRIEHSKKVVELHFKVPKAYTLRKFGKIHNNNSVKNVYLIDEIFSRVLKMHFERIYCSKFWKHHVEIDKIWVSIEFYSNPQDSHKFSERDLKVHDDITFTLQDHEYPYSPLSIYQMCPSLKLKNGGFITGENLEKVISKVKPRQIKRVAAKKKIAKKKRTLSKSIRK